MYTVGSRNKSWPVCVAITRRSQTHRRNERRKKLKLKHNNKNVASCVPRSNCCSCFAVFSFDTYDLRCISQWFIVYFLDVFFCFRVFKLFLEFFSLFRIFCSKLIFLFYFEHSSPSDHLFPVFISLNFIWIFDCV